MEEKLYVVNISESFSIYVGVMAESEYEAEDKAEELFASGKYEMAFIKSSSGADICAVSPSLAEALIEDNEVIMPKSK